MTVTLPALLRFHVHVGARLALRVLAPVIAAVVGAATLLGMDFVDSFAVTVFGTREEGGSGVIAAVACFGVAAMAVPRVCRGLNGWVRHLPVSGVAQRRAALLAITVAQLPLLLLLVSVFSLIAAPAINAFTRHMEREADRFGLEITQYNHSAATAFVKLQTDVLAVPRPGWLNVLWRQSHPPLGDRIDFANEYHPWRNGAPLAYGDRFKP